MIIKKIIMARLSMIMVIMRRMRITNIKFKGCSVVFSANVEIFPFQAREQFPSQLIGRREAK